VRVVDVGTPPAPPVSRLCPRCRGASDHSAQFCRFCGASLADAPSVPIQPSANPIASAPPLALPPAPPLVASSALAPGVDLGGVRAIRAEANEDLGTARPRGADLNDEVRAAVDRTPVAEVIPAALRRAVEPPPNRVDAPTGPPPPTIAPATQARLVLILRDGGEGPTYPLGESTDIGRTEGNIVLSDDKYISPRHARISHRGGIFTLRDLESTNGIYVRIPFARGASVRSTGAPGTLDESGPERGRGSMPPANEWTTDAGSEQVLTDQDLFLVGQQVLRFEVVKHAEEGFGVASDHGTLLFGTPAAPRYARLSQRTVEGVARDVYHLKKVETVIGREQGDVVFTDDPFLSRRHAVVRVHAANAHGGPRRFTLADLGSSNGTFLQVREEVRLRHGDHFRIGQQLFRFDT
jgi:pSer/pThr/pTyr-binding forkhead associated (FHA) protein